MKLIIKLSLLLITVLILSCDSTQNTDKGFLEGKITIGPLCPVETIPPKPECQPTSETYKNWPVFVWTADKKNKVVLIEPDLNGNYKVDLPIGTYVVDLDMQHYFGKNLPAIVVISSNKTTVLEVSIDTGIR
ncbi:hypothetical protein [Flavobacterium cellulosilyticum]|uniref:Carboxypeptidase regulatory-like domain-containing protein n=1 Tax=Flavobacterium cellulosilyticum TaxID=2541731 RepID=A0A4R5CLY5_9FLAO|nr:hypothetical protein [Flavobacterium cellulosilyticum]TDD99660.1 hypothetical protein E0F76_02755 [Flavobacterium cellulosilyticum]